MHPIFRITSSDIKSLNDSQARELVARLCKAELHANGIGADAVTWGGDQRAKDGGVDVRVATTDGTDISGYIPSASTVFQVKAELFGKSKIREEIAPKGTLRPSINELADKLGAYVIVSTRDDLSDLFLSERKQAMVDCLQEHGFGGRILLDFYDSRKIADWIESKPAIVTWVKNELGKPLEGWRPYGAWAYHESNVEDEYLLDDKVKVSIPNAEEGIAVIDAINKLREDLSRSNSSVRIVGLSGVGKTRLVQALFDSRITTANAPLDQVNVLYSDLSDNPTPQPVAMLEALVFEGADSIVVIDNCGQDVHQKLTEIVKRSESKVRLLTVEYDIRDNIPEGTTCYHVQGSSSNVVASLLRRRFKNLSDLEIDKIVDFSDGNARVAFALASTSEGKGELAQLRDDQLFKRLFIQKRIENDELQRCAEAASLLYSFDFEDTSNNSELGVMSDVAEVTISKFYRNVTELQGRGLVQARGKWRAVLPHAISNRLALNAVESYPPSLLVEKFVTSASERVMRSFSRRLGYLHESKNAQKIVGEWLKPGGLLGDILSLSELKREMLENIAPVNQGAALNALLRAADSPNFSTISHESRLSLTRLLRSLAYDEELFDEAATALTKFALEEADNHRSNSIRNVLQSLFHSHLSGTLALPSQRSAFTRKLAFSDDSRLAKLALILLQAGLESNHFSSDYGFDFGALKRGYGWHPRTAGEIYEWYSLFIRIAVDIGKSGTAIASNARSILGASFRDLWTEARMEEALTDAARDFASIDGWPDGWIGIRNTLHWDKKRISAESLAKLKMLEVELAPKDLRAKIHAKVLSRGSYGADLDEFDSDSPMASYEKAQEEARTLGRAAAQDAGSLADLTPFLLNGDTSNKVWNFGVGVGETSTSPSGVIDQLEVLIKQPDAAGFDLQFIHGLIAGWQKSKPEEVAIFLDEAVEDPVWSALFPYLQSSVELEARGHARLIRSLEFGHAPRLHYTCFGSGRRTASLDVTQISTFLSLLATKADGGLIAAIDVLAMVIHGTDLKDEQYKADLRSYCLGFIGDLDWNSVDFANENFLYHLERIIKFALGHANPCGVVNKTLNRLLGQERAREQMFPRRLGQVLLPFFEKCPVEALNVFYDKDDHALTMRMLTMRLNRHGDTAISVVPEDVLLDWCKVSPEDRTVFAAESCTIFERSKSEPISDEITIGISSVARNVLKSAPNKRKILEIFARRFAPRSWSGSIAAIMRQRFQYLDELKPENDEELTRLVDEIKGRLSRIIAAEEKLEQEEERSGTASFE